MLTKTLRIEADNKDKAVEEAHKEFQTYREEDVAEGYSQETNKIALVIKEEGE